MRGIKIIGTGKFIPETKIDNNFFASYLETDDEWIESRTGIKERRYAVETPNFIMAANAAADAVKDSGLNPEDIDLILASTCSPDFFYPALSCLVQARIGAVNAAAYDLNAACTGFICGLDMASRYLQDGDYKNVLVVASERISPHIDFNDRGSCVLFGDGAGAAVVTRSDKPMYSYLSAKGDYFEALYCKVDSSRSNFPLKKEEPEIAPFISGEKRDHSLQMNGKDVYKFAVDAMATAAAKAIERAGLTIDDIDLVIPHQANTRIIQSAVKNMGIPTEKIYVALRYRGNTSSACIPTCLDDLKKEGKIKDGMKICLVGFGAGLTSGAIVFEQ